MYRLGTVETNNITKNRIIMIIYCNQSYVNLLTLSLKIFYCPVLPLLLMLLCRPQVTKTMESETEVGGTAVQPSRR